ncbi:immunoglobulin I-set domain protein [Necator americanus]|uniref:Immunoglobulin I-set domain protein n=1 Tax=Necator americanus TaxID=51031 RepID=W2TL13_NECAM|nr:immunoglobulin I-set domain protein [Necator americanus]ETN81722.1 immunoglobulin I-set domain protein [Necator americanus]
MSGFDLRRFAELQLQKQNELPPFQDQRWGILTIRHTRAPETGYARKSPGTAVENIGRDHKDAGFLLLLASIHPSSSSFSLNSTPFPVSNPKSEELELWLGRVIYAIRQTPAPETGYARTTAGSAVENIGAIRQTPAPERRRATTTSGTAVENIGAIRTTPAPETGFARKTSVSALENIGAIRQTPVPETGSATVTRSALENIGAIRRTPAPETGHATKIPGSAVENIGAIRQSEPVHPHTATKTDGAMKENVAQINPTTAQPDKREFTRSSLSIDRIDDIVVPERAPHTTAEVSQTVTAEGFIRHLDQDFTPTQVTTTERSVRGGVTMEQGERVRREAEAVVTVTEKTREQDAEERRQLEQLEQMEKEVEERLRRGPEVQKRVTQTTSAEGWVQRVEDDVAKPQVVQTTKRIEKEVTEDSRSKPHSMKAKDLVPSGQWSRPPGPEETRATKPLLLGTWSLLERSSFRRLRGTKRRKRGRQKIVQSRIPQRTTKVTTTTTADGFVQHLHDEISRPTEVTTKTRKEGEDAQFKRTVEMRRAEPTTEKTTTTTTTSLVQTAASRPLQPTTKTQKTTEEREEKERYRDSFIAKIVQSRIPQRTTKVTTTTTADGFVQHLHDEISRPTEVTTKTRKEGEDAQFKRTVEMRRAEPTTEKTTTTTTTSLVQTAASRPLQPTTKTQKTTEEREEKERYRDSFIAASEGEGFWTDGAYTTSPSPPPISSHLSRTYTEPQFIKSLHREYTVDEEGSITIECTLVGNPRPKVRFFLNDREIRKESKFVEIVTSGDTYSIVIKKARLEHAGYYKVVAENERGKTESLTMLHVRPLSLIQHQRRNGFTAPSQKITEYKTPTEHTTVTEEFAMFEYEQRRPQKHETSRLVTPPPAKRFQAHRKDEEMLEQYDINQRQPAGHPPHFTQTLVAAVAADGESARFDGIVTGWPAPTVEWTKDGEPFSRDSLPDVEISNIGGRVSLSFKSCHTVHSGKYMCTARNVSGVATSSAQLVVRPRTVAPDFIQRLISEEKVEGEQLKWTVRVTGDPLPKVTWLRDGIEIPDCEEVRIIDEGNGVHSLLIVRVELADSGQFTCLAENVAGEARSTADLVVRQSGSRPGSYFHITKVTQEKQTQGEQPVRNTAFTIENPPLQSAML